MGELQKLTLEVHLAMPGNVHRKLHFLKLLSLDFPSGEHRVAKNLLISLWLSVRRECA